MVLLLKRVLLLAVGVVAVAVVQQLVQSVQQLLRVALVEQALLLIHRVALAVGLPVAV